MSHCVCSVSFCSTDSPIDWDDTASQVPPSMHQREWHHRVVGETWAPAYWFVCIWPFSTILRAHTFLTSLQPVSILNFLIATVSLHLCSLGTELLHRPESSQTLLFLSSGQKNLSGSDLKLLFPINRLISFNLTFLSLQKNIIIFWVCVYFICLGFFCKPTGIFSSAPYFLLIYSLFSEDFHVFVFYPCIPYDCSWGSELVRRLAYCCCLFVFFHIHSASWYM